MEYFVSFDRSILDIKDLSRNALNEAFIQRTEYETLLKSIVPELPISHTVQIQSSTDQGRAGPGFRQIRGKKITTLLVQWTPPSATTETRSAQVKVTTSYTGVREAALSNCCFTTAQNSQAATLNNAQSQAFLAITGSEAGVNTTGSGLQYVVLREGDGSSHPVGSSSVTVNYRGLLPSGVNFDTGSRVSFSLNGVIGGWTEGLQLMSPGAKYRFYIPSHLAYGVNGSSSIGPNAALVFDVELIGFTTP
jgi:FKBP-type peptidyl-prolyl cis-trans isomerase